MIRSLSSSTLLVCLGAAGASAQTSAELLELRRETGPGGVRLVATSTAPLLFDYASPAVDQLVLRLHGVEPGPIVGALDAWQPEAAVDVTREVAVDGRAGTTLSVTLTPFRRYRIRSEGNSLVMFLPALVSTSPAAVGSPAAASEPAAAAPPSLAALTRMADGSAAEPPESLGPPPPLPEPVEAESAAKADESLVEMAAAIEPPAPSPEPVEPETQATVDEPPVEMAEATEPSPPVSESIEPAESRSGPAPPDIAEMRDLSLAVGDPVGPGAGTATRVLDLHYTREETTLTVHLETDGPPTHRVFGLQGPERLVLDLIGMETDPPQRGLAVGESGILRIRLAQHQTVPERVVRLVVDLEQRVPHRIAVGERSLKITFAAR